MTTSPFGASNGGTRIRRPGRDPVNLLFALLGGLALGALFFLDKSSVKAIEDRPSSLPASPAGPETDGRVLRIEGINEPAAKDGALARAEVPNLPRSTPVRVRVEGKADYPRLALMERLEGSVDLEVTVDAQGRPVACSASEGNKILKKAALDSAATWRFDPATRHGRPVPATFLIHYDFRLHPERSREIGA